MTQPRKYYLGLSALFAVLLTASAQPLLQFDFTKETAGWTPAHDISGIKPGPDGLAISISGPDPYIYGPSRDYPPDQPLWAHFKFKSDSPGMAQLFYFQTNATEENSIRFYVEGDTWTDVRVPMPALGPKTQIRFDPPGASGVCVLQNISFEPRIALTEPSWARAGLCDLGTNPISLTAGAITLLHSREHFGACEVRVNGTNMAVGNDHPQLGYTANGIPRWITLTNPANVVFTNGSATARLAFTDPDGADWLVVQSFKSDCTNGDDGIAVQTTVTVDRDRSVIYLPMLTLLPGVGSFDTNKTQGLLAGVEYLENEASSSELDVIGPGSRRRVPDSLKLTFPLMAIAAKDRYIGLIWEQQPSFAALHDSPDRLFHSGGSLMSVIYPGANPATREDGSVLPYQPQLLRAGEPLTLHATIIGGQGATIVPAVQQYVARRGLPAVPKTGYTASEYYYLAAHGWLDSKGRAGALYKPAVADNFSATPSADAALYMDWLAAKTPDQALRARLTTAAREALAGIEPRFYNSTHIGHICYPVEALVYGAVPENAEVALNVGRAHLAHLRPDGSTFYPPPNNGLDLGKTHWTREANGLVAPVVMTVLENAIYSGDKALIAEGLRLLRAQDKYRNTVPRGAQTWEVPLHTPDILASAWMVRIYTLGYELTGETDFLDQARYWAWTGVPFIYLTPPNNKPVGVYSTIPVFGATQFIAPLWIGLPVQWCGLDYGDAIRRLARHDPTGPWIQIADGIAAVGVQHTHPASNTNYVGLLPDSFDLRTQVRNEPPITPATVLAQAHQLFGDPAVYDFCATINRHLLILAPGPIVIQQEDGNRVTFSINAWPSGPWYLLVNGFDTKPAVKINGVQTALQSPHLFAEREGRLILQLTGKPVIEIQLP